MVRPLAVLLLVAGAGHWSSASAASMEVLSLKDSETPAILIEGDIGRGDYLRLREIYEKVVRPGTKVGLNSPGGDVGEAMRIGDFLEEKRVSVVVVGSCASSCVLILAGGNFKTVAGRVGIHRPYLVDTHIPADKIRELFPKLKDQLGDYFEKKGVPRSLAEDMFSIPPERVKWLTTDEIAKYRLDRKSYIVEEQDDVRYSQELGMSRAEYLAKKRRLSDECSTYKGQFDEMKKCVTRIMGAP
ncbi:ATP-dependent Clp protease proteolytic subunit [Niveibacterium sp. SC-1]|uniref:ATP-dependent Clp protease proteolytic subunit n=1 Tax=Niveibacterium sp. SC-1 TaxID=3135646 RepID=UPI00311FAD35